MSRDLAAAYDECRRLNARHGRSFYLATLLLPAAKRPAIHALYAFARLADDVVDRPGAERAAAANELADLQQRFRANDESHPVIAAVNDTVDRWDIDRALFDEFFASMRMDLDVTTYATWTELLRYMYGSAAVIGLQTLPILAPTPGLYDAAAPYARDLGLGFQLTNFLRDVGEDLARGRVYVPQQDLAEFGVTETQLHARVVDEPFRRLMAYEIERARGLLSTAAIGIRLLHPTSRDCVRTALRLYAGILDEIERADYRVLDRRVAVGTGRRAAVALPALGRAWWSRRPHQTHHANVCNTNENPNATSSIGAHANLGPSTSSPE
jgi:phytoene synthase